MRYLRVLALGAAVLAGLFGLAHAQTYPGIFACAVHQWMSSIGIGGSPACSQPAASDLSNGVIGSGAVVLQASPGITGVLDVQGAFKLSNENAPAQITVDQNDYNPGSVVCSSTTTLVINSSAARNITGLAGGIQGCETYLVNNGSFSITLKDSNVSSAAANRFGFGGDYVLATKGSIHLKYDGTDSLWRNMSGIGAGAGSGTVTSATIAPGAGMGTFTGPCTITTSGTCTIVGSAVQLPGTATNDNASAGNLGEMAECTGTSNVGSGTLADMCSKSMTAGDWECSADVQTNTGGNITGGNIWVNATTATDPGFRTSGNGAGCYLTANVPTGTNLRTPIGVCRFSLATTTTLFLSESISYTVSNTNTGYLHCRRAR